MYPLLRGAAVVLSTHGGEPAALGRSLSQDLFSKMLWTEKYAFQLTERMPMKRFRGREMHRM